MYIVYVVLSNSWMICEYRIGKMWDSAAVAYFNLLSLHSHGVTENSSG
jgi:hypothetical protein